MEEVLVQFETAKLAKDKGYNITNIFSYDENTGLMLPKDPAYPGWHCYALEGVCPAPTQSLLQKWLREKYKLEVHVSFNPDWEWNDKDECLCVNKGYRVDWGFVGIWKKYETESYPLEKSNISTYEEALEVGLQEALKLIK